MSFSNKHSVLSSLLLATTMILASCSGIGTTDPEAGADDTSVDGAADGEVAAGLLDDDSAAGSLGALSENQVSHFDEEDLDYDESRVVTVSLNGTSASADADSVLLDGATITITREGVYTFSGTLDDGHIVVDAGDDDSVTLVLDGVDITHSDGAAIAVMNADDALIVLAEGTSNRLTDGAVYAFPDAETDEPNATLYSAADLSIAGEGELVVAANYNDGIASKDGLVIDSGLITVTAVDDGVRGKDYVIINGGAVSIVSAGDGIKADNEEDVERGYVLVSDGSVTIVAGDDGVQAATDVLIAGGQLDIDAGASSGAGRALQGDVVVSITGGVINAIAVDDAIHSNTAVLIGGGTLTIAAGDDGIHGDDDVTIDGGFITITDSFEGIEAEVITINDGVVDVTSNDDGLNVASAEAEAVTATPPVGGRGGGGGGGGGGVAEVVGEHYVYINGGTISITITDNLAEQGDGIDANGHVVMTGGVVSVSGPTDTRNSAIDYSGGSFAMTGGLFVGTNVDGRNSEGVGVGSSQASLYITTGTTISAGTVVHIETSDGQGLMAFQPENDFSVIVVSSPDLVAGESYNVHLGATVSGDSATNLYEATDATRGEHVGTAVASL